MQQKVSVKDIAKELHISLSTVHKALTGKSGVSEARRKEVQETAIRLGYEVNSVAQSLARKDIRIGVFMPLKWQSYFSGMKAGMEEELDALKKYKVSGLFYFVSTDLSDNEAEKALGWIRENHLDVLIYCPSMYALNPAFVEALQKTKLPVFLAGGSFENINCISEVCVDAVLSGKIAADFLYCTKGTGLRAAVFTGSMHVKPHKEKAEAFQKRIQTFGSEAFIFETEDDVDKTMECIRLALEKDINAIYVATATSEPVCAYIEQNHLSDKISLICTDLFDALIYYMKKNIVKATIHQNQEKVGKCAVRSAYDYLVGKHSYGTIPKIQGTIYVQPHLYLLANIE